MSVTRHIISGKRLYIIENLLTRAACQDIIVRAETVSALHRAPDVRSSYYRTIFTDRLIVDILMETIRPFLPVELSENVVIGDELRYNKYYSGDFIAIHLDGINMSRRMQNAFTVNIYLNDDFSGGETVFYDDNRAEVLRVVPSVGTAVIFEPHIYHAGDTVSSGSKSIMRGCIYRAT